MIAGGLAQLARAPALQAGGQRFESVILHRRSLTCWKKREQEHEANHINPKRQLSSNGEKPQESKKGRMGDA